jgi:hypothetical protein
MFARARDLEVIRKLHRQSRPFLRLCARAAGSATREVHLEQPNQANTERDAGHHLRSSTATPGLGPPAAGAAEPAWLVQAWPITRIIDRIPEKRPAGGAIFVSHVRF